jgi:hypothetical protein
VTKYVDLEVALGFYLRGIWIESLPGNGVSYVRYFVIFLMPFKEIIG